MRDVNLIVVHCAATPPGMDIGVAEIDRWHKARGWSGCGYHSVIRRDGTLEHGRELAKVGAHAKGHNRRSVGVCLVGGVDDHNKPDNNFTEAQFDELKDELDRLLVLFPGSEICGHRDLPGVDKACPSFDVKPWWAGRSGQQITDAGAGAETSEIKTMDVLQLMLGHEVVAPGDKIKLSGEAQEFVRVLYERLGGSE